MCVGHFIGTSWQEREERILSEQAGYLQDDKTIDRLEEAMVRIASAMEQQARAREEREREARSAPDLPEIAANIDALCVRIRGILERKGE
ncbi:hypothetical protein Gbth_005_004 [Gluconobacter thailandicus F149-1 = NBRC 100600]|uniref:Uncharacterized protein n=1 Tax=Gluconobacter thailandicus NBRC 3257 TaxID=1381097 RepID=A0ABQ0IT03_GLUTH|nr:hypothetical protein [Gluconobacter thailandicus]AFW01733.1 hypothetical protein B932_2166 [Gluconobacter oxydans H24]ANQ42653.1 hypothetical protein BAR24_15100 [Gluconobacter oxydans]GAD25332.1 hypothetical protein NBRC3257_0331 [Gluconobacter thailandicus NBRC 3257]GAN90677.1 hypothetical protein Gbfr_021_004 [Gluconobacter frateurii M-2]KXV55068.1 hypothetical protein AD946_00435 [Gluconobacter thailandicus]